MRDASRSSENRFRSSSDSTRRPGTRTQLDGELYFDEAYFFDLKATLPDVCDVQALHREQGFSNELGYRFDVILKKDLGEKLRENARDDWTMRPSKRLWTNWHLRGLPESNPSTTVTSANVAYIIFTSGSTGEPKGVMVQHRPIINVIEWVNTTFKVGPGDRLLFVTSLTFDLSVYDIFGTLAAGATIHVASRADLREPRRLARMLQRATDNILGFCARCSPTTGALLREMNRTAGNT